MKTIIYPRTPSENFNPLNKKYPVSLLPIAGKPLIEHQLELLAQYRLKEIIIISDHLSSKIKQTIANGTRWGLKISHKTQKEKMDLAQTLQKLNLNPKRKENYLLIPNDTIFSINLQQLASFHSQNINMCTIVSSKEANTGIYLLDSPFLLELKKHNTISFDQICQSKNKNYFKQNIFAQKIENLKTYHKANISALNQQYPHLIISGKEKNKDIHIGLHSKISKTSKIIAPIIIGDNTIIEKDCIIGPNVTIGKNCIINDSSHIENSYIYPDTFVGSLTSIKNKIIDKNWLIDIATQTSTKIVDYFILGDTKKKLTTRFSLKNIKSKLTKKKH